MTDDEKTEILKKPSHYELRDMLEEMVMNDLIGPAGGPEEEVDESRVRERYLTGMLAPRQLVVTQQEIDGLATSGSDSNEEGTSDTGALQANTFFPSSIGMTFSVDGRIGSIKVTAKWGHYEKGLSETALTPTGEPKSVWKRTPIEEVITLLLKEGNFAPVIVTEDFPDVTIKGRIRRQDAYWLITLFLVNGQEEPKKTPDTAWLFQPELIVESTDGSPIFRRRPQGALESSRLRDLARQEMEDMSMLYRHRVQFGVGHGVSVHVEVDQDNPEQAFKVMTRIVPSIELPKFTPPTVEDNTDLEGLILDMQELSGMEPDALLITLRVLPDAYLKWIERQEARIKDPSDDLYGHADAAGRAMESCRKACKRIVEGIDLLANDPVALESFRFANRAMWQQRVHTIYSREVFKKQNPTLEAIDIPKNRSWYPFQLAFILLNLPGITVLHHEDRSEEPSATADLLWYPTGGGKTEAYLGLSAYTMSLRRLQGVIEGRSGEHGVAVLMRYTLRLLTLQQFQRATALICACELIRRENPEKWGREPFRIGLWVGMKATPNTTEQAHQVLQESHGSGYFNTAAGTPAQISYCPWCGAEINDRRGHIKAFPGVAGPLRTIIYCGDTRGACPFSERQSQWEGIPAVVVDEEIYRRLPSLLISTVDKFAQMPWKGQVQMLFGQVNGFCPRHGFRSPEINDEDSHRKYGQWEAVKTVPHNPLRPPDLIIQDELHLISGPLGSLVGLYETAIDSLATWTVDGKRVRPKVIASTATIRRAQEQVHALFCRHVEVFPPHGTDVKDNFFSLERKPDEANAGRKYIGICAPGKRFPAALIRVYVALLASAQKLYEQYDRDVDPWMTLVGYFNSLRELGGMRRLVEDDITSRLRDIDKRGLAKRPFIELEELTSRKTGVDIPKVLSRLDIGFSKEYEDGRKKQREEHKDIDPRPYDVILATNMISVGVDINRLGLMVAAGQPKTTAEYIQATSRIGRAFPGLVVTVFNWARPRDLSHYELFEHYHATFYQHVEALSVTPFAERALDRGLTGVMVSLIRLPDDQMNPNDKASKLVDHDDHFEQARKRIEQRADDVLSPDTADHVDKMLKFRRDLWLKEARDTKTTILCYSRERDDTSKPLLHQAGLTDWGEFTCLNSLRDVEPSVNLILSEGHGMDPKSEPVEESEETDAKPE